MVDPMVTFTDPLPQYQMLICGSTEGDGDRDGNEEFSCELFMIEDQTLEVEESDIIKRLDDICVDKEFSGDGQAITTSTEAPTVHIGFIMRWIISSVRKHATVSI